MVYHIIELADKKGKFAFTKTSEPQMGRTNKHDGIRWA
jgi:hypothetical protein